eukprot:CAMPEP_0117473258 /NCGR_PEP_ID=MMETSP0784-20121206/8680_1 /TAXON_ID=39447 /ORGANISM="" /LENGTH=408 /DNA_ID=CAMNT_0005267455 /DNA_START=104 /DNA_END=1330 /DNA_ORIENTATION=-
MTFGAEGQVKPDVAGIILRSFVGAGCTKTSAGSLIDTARIYQQATPDGDTESTLGAIFGTFPSLERRTSVATKVNPNMAPHYSLSKQSVIDSCETSLSKLGLDCIDLFYLHAPDINTDLDDTLAGVKQLHEEGKIKEFGLSNYPAWAVVDIWHRCKARGMVVPTVYQGMYNVITRDMERDIVPVAREFGLRLYMYNPLAGGLLSGRYATMEDLSSATDGRFSAEFDSAFGTNLKAGTGIYRKRYSKQPFFDAVQTLRDACARAADGPPTGAGAAEPVANAEGTETCTFVDGIRVRVQVEEKPPQPRCVDMASVALRWLIHHSHLGPGDGVILGVSKREHLVANLAAWQAGPLPSHILDACDAAWEAARPVCEPYFRGYGAMPGGIEKFVALKKEQQAKARNGTAEMPR